MTLSATSESLPLVSIVIVNFNGRTYLNKLLDACLESVLKTEYRDFEVLFVDNASTDDSATYVRKKYGTNSRLRVIELKKNFGYSGGVNEGVTYAKGDIIAVLNTDVIVTPNWLKESVQTAQFNENVGVVTSKILIQKPQWDTAGGEIDVLLVGNDRLVKGKELGLRCFHPSGAAFIIKRKLVENLRELFDADFFAYFEDVDLGWRCQLLKFDVLYCPNSIVFHKRGGSFGLASPLKFYLMRRNALSSATKNACTTTVLKLLPLWLLSTLYASYLFCRASRNMAYLISGLKVIYVYLVAFKEIWKKHVQMQSLRKIDDNALFAKFNNTLFVNRPNTIINRLGFAFVRSWLKMCRINAKIVGFKIYPTLELLKTCKT